MTRNVEELSKPVEAASIVSYEEMTFRALSNGSEKQQVKLKTHILNLEPFTVE